MILSLEGAAFRAEELEAAKFFTTAEVRCMFRKRARFEYLLGRRGVPLAKYIQCIRFELGVINLLAIRKEQQPPVEMNQCSITRGLNRRVHLLYQRALRKFRGNVGIWLEFAAYCYANGNEALMSEVISHALQLNPTCAGLWSFSAFWEFKRMADISSARHLLLRGLRNSPESKVLWIEFCALELSYEVNTRLRHDILGMVREKQAFDNSGHVIRYIFCSAVNLHEEDSTLLHQLLSLFFSHLVGESEFKLSKHLSNVLDKISHVRWCNSCVHLRGQEISLNTDNNASFILSEPDTSRVFKFLTMQITWTDLNSVDGVQSIIGLLSVGAKQNQLNRKTKPACTCCDEHRLSNFFRGFISRIRLGVLCSCLEENSDLRRDILELSTSIKRASFLHNAGYN